MLLGIYLGTSAVSFATILLYSAALSNKIKRDGYKFVEKSFIENMIGWLQTIFKSFLPVYNILNTIVLLCSGDKYFEHFEDKLLKEGKIYLPQNNYNVIGKEEKSVCANTNVVSNEKKYEDMTTKEKLAYLEKEKEKLLKDSKKEKESPVLRKSFNYNK